jgi:hypothetical protein
MRAIPLRQIWLRSTMLLFLTSVCGCARSSSTTRIALRGTPSAEALAAPETMQPLAPVPVVRTPPSQTVTIRIPRHSYGPALDPREWPLMVVNGVALGRRSDGTVDPGAAQRSLERFSCRDVVSIQFVQSDEALKRFGPAGHRGAMLIVVRPSHDSLLTEGR